MNDQKPAEVVAPWPQNPEDVTREALTTHYAALSIAHHKAGVAIIEAGREATDARKMNACYAAAVDAGVAAWLLHEITDEQARALWHAVDSGEELHGAVWEILHAAGIDDDTIRPTR